MASTSASLLESIIQETKDAFVAAKADGKLEAVEVVQIASTVAQKIYKIGSLSLADKKALVLLALKKGLDAADGLHGLLALTGAGPVALEAAEKQILNAALASVDGLMNAVPRLFAPARNALLAYLPFCSILLPSDVALDPKDSALIHEAFSCVAAVSGQGVVASDVVTSLESAAESVADKSAPPQHTLEESTLPPILLGVAPNHETSVVELPVPGPLPSLIEEPSQ